MSIAPSRDLRRAAARPAKRQRNVDNLTQLCRVAKIHEFFTREFLEFAWTRRAGRGNSIVSLGFNRGPGGLEDLSLPRRRACPKLKGRVMAYFCYIHRIAGGVPHFEVLPAVLVLVGRTDDTHHVLLGRKRDGA